MKLLVYNVWWSYFIVIQYWEVVEGLSSHSYRFILHKHSKDWLLFNITTINEGVLFVSRALVAPSWLRMKELSLFYSISSIHCLKMFWDERLLLLVIRSGALIAPRSPEINKSQRRYKLQDQIWNLWKNDCASWVFFILYKGRKYCGFCYVYVNYFFFFKLILKEGTNGSYFVGSHVCLVRLVELMAQTFMEIKNLYFTKVWDFSSYMFLFRI